MPRKWGLAVLCLCLGVVNERVPDKVCGRSKRRRGERQGWKVRIDVLLDRSVSKLDRAFVSDVPNIAGVEVHIAVPKDVTRGVYQVSCGPRTPA